MGGLRQIHLDGQGTPTLKTLSLKEAEGTGNEEGTWEA